MRSKLKIEANVQECAQKLINKNPFLKISSKSVKSKITPPSNRK